MFRRILVPLDGSSFAEAAIPAAASVAADGGAEVRLVCVQAATPIDPESSWPFEPDGLAWAEAYLAEAAARIRATWSGALTTSVRSGEVTEEILAAADEWDADLIAVATHGRGGVSRAWLASVADSCIRRAQCPVLALRPAESNPGATSGRLGSGRGRIVVPLDGSPLAEAALPYGAPLAQRLGVPLLLLSAVPDPEIAAVYRRLESTDPSVAAEQYLAEQLARLREEGVRAEAYVVTDVATAHAILTEAGGDLVVMSTHGRGGLDRAIFGSVTDQVVRGTAGAVLVVRPAGSGRKQRSVGWPTVGAAAS